METVPVKLAIADDNKHIDICGYAILTPEGFKMTGGSMVKYTTAQDAFSDMAPNDSLIPLRMYPLRKDTTNP